MKRRRRRRQPAPWRKLYEAAIDAITILVLVVIALVIFL